LVEVEELQRKLNSPELYIDIGGKVEELQRKLVNLLTKFGFQTSLRAEGLAFFPGNEQSWKGLPSIRLTRAGTVLVMRVHASDTLTTLNASTVNSTPVDVYRRIMNGLVQAGKLYQEYGRKATYVSVSPDLIEPEQI
jgi:hypothetical protein